MVATNVLFPSQEVGTSERLCGLIFRVRQKTHPGFCSSPISASQLFLQPAWILSVDGVIVNAADP
jgi:hypothetical protein